MDAIYALAAEPGLIEGVIGTIDKQVARKLVWLLDQDYSYVDDFMRIEGILFRKDDGCSENTCKSLNQ